MPFESAIVRVFLYSHSVWPVRVDTHKHMRQKPRGSLWGWLNKGCSYVVCKLQLFLEVFLIPLWWRVCFFVTCLITVSRVFMDLIFNFSFFGVLILTLGFEDNWYRFLIIHSERRILLYFSDWQKKCWMIWWMKVFTRSHVFYYYFISIFYLNMFCLLFLIYYWYRFRKAYVFILY